MHTTTDSPLERWAAARPDLDTSPMEVISLVKRVESLMAAAVEPLYAGAPLTPAEADLLIRLRHATEPTIARRLSDEVGLSRAAISKTLGKLDKRGFIQREPSQADRRATLLTLTPAGQAAVDALFPRQLAVEAALLAGLGDRREQVIQALRALIASMRAAQT